jgi:hypothetical protein
LAHPTWGGKGAKRLGTTQKSYAACPYPEGSRREETLTQKEKTRRDANLCSLMSYTPKSRNRNFNTTKKKKKQKKL